ncbi:MAG TPA: peptidylprolyl isomerase [Thermoanaerobaculia bacterium]|nr:peptidylprolyl isomerase [Thermoanaerobaculia bacterium]
MRRPLVALLLLLFCAYLPACKRKPSIPPDVVVRIGERNVTLADFKRYLDRNTGTELAQVTPEVASALLDQYVEEIVLSEYAATHGVEVPAEKIASAVRNEAGSTVIEKRDEMRRQKLIADLSADVPQASDDEVRAYYETHPAEFKSGEEVRVRQILVHDEALAGQIASQLRKGGSFEELSGQYSVAPNAKKGGDIGYVSRGELPKMFEDVIFSLEPGGVSDVIRTDSTFHVFKVDERRGPGTVDIITAAPVIRERLREEAIRQKMAQLVSRSRAEMQIAVLTKRLPYKYTGTLPKSDNE